MPDKKSAIPQSAKKILYNGFFTVKEIEEISKMKTPDGSLQEVNINGDLWKAVRKRRMADVNHLRSQRYSDVQIRAMLGRLARAKDAPTPWDFLKIEYKPAKLVKDYQEKVKAIKAKINKQFTAITGDKYFKPVAVHNARYSPVRRPIPPHKRSKG